MLEPEHLADVLNDPECVQEAGLLFASFPSHYLSSEYMGNLLRQCREKRSSCEIGEMPASVGALLALFRGCQVARDALRGERNALHFIAQSRCRISDLQLYNNLEADPLLQSSEFFRVPE